MSNYSTVSWEHTITLVLPIPDNMSPIKTLAEQGKKKNLEGKRNIHFNFRNSNKNDKYTK